VLDDGAARGRQSRVVLAPRRWCQVREAIRGRWWLTSPAHQGDHGEAVKTIAQGMPGQSGEPVATTLVCLLTTSHTRLRVHWASGIPCALSFIWGGKFQQNPGASRRENAEVCLTAVIARSAWRGALATKQSRNVTAARIWIASRSLSSGGISLTMTMSGERRKRGGLRRVGTFESACQAVRSAGLPSAGARVTKTVGLVCDEMVILRRGSVHNPFTPAGFILKPS
jgi:hypothetical protein